MSKNKPVRVRKKSHLTGVVFWTCLILIGAPCLIMAWILLSSYLDTGAPVLGNRYDGDLDPAITRTNIDTVVEGVQQIPNVEKAWAEMPTATLRVYADVGDFVDLETVQSVTDQIYDVVAANLNPDIYFRQTETKKMYDLEIHVYNLGDNRDSDSFIYVIGTKTSSMDSMRKDLVSEPKDAELAESLRRAAYERVNGKPEENPEGGDIIVGEDTSLEDPSENSENPEESGGEGGE